MSKFEDKRINDFLQESDAYKSTTDRQDPNDKMIRAFILNKENLDIIKQKPNSQVKLKEGKSVTLEFGSYITSNGRVLAPETFQKHYKPASSFVKSFLKNKINLSDNVPDIIERLHNKQGQKTQRPSLKN